MSAIAILTDFVLQRSKTEDSEVRINLYRALAEVAPVPDEAARLRRMAADLESVDQRHEQLLLDLRTSRSRNPFPPAAPNGEPNP